jgi:tetratricopeptide (TPR) repeat protein/tRNA A-37 threonylcarbamoyl transferase component Bud32
LDEDTIVAFIGARLEPERITRVEAHVRGCAACGELLTLALGGARGPREAAHDHPVPSDSGALARGTAFGRYTVLGPLGRGAMGEVYAAYDPELDRKVALKILHRVADGADERSRGRLLREAKAIAKLRHPNVILVHDAGTIDGRVFLAMEHVEGQTLAAWLAEKPRTRKEIVDVFAAAGRGLHAAHAAGIAHRDFKPQNVMVDGTGGVRVMDFGLAREIGETEPAAATAPMDVDLPGAHALPLTRTGEIVGTPLYMPPEGFKTQRADARSDQFSFCVALYQALYGAHPFGGKNLGELIAAVTAGRVLPPPPKSTVPPWLRRVVLRGLSADPAARWPSMEALTAALEHDPARTRGFWLAGVAVAAAIVAVAAAVRTRSGHESICHRGPERLAGVWEPAASGDSSRRAATKAAFSKTGVEYAADLWQRAAGLLDRYREGWLQMYQETCTATHERGDQSVQVLDLRMACLTERLGRVKALTDVFADANATVVENAVSAAGALPSLDRCADVEQLRAVMPPPENPAARARVEALRQELARVVALQDSGQCAAASASSKKLNADAEQLAYLPLRADVLVSAWRSLCVPFEENITNCRRAAMAALVSHHDEAFIEAASCVADLQADMTPDIARARDWMDLSTASMERASGSHPVLESYRLIALGNVYRKEGNYARALDTLERARLLVAQTRGTEHLDYARVLNVIGVVLVDLGRFDEAATQYQHAADAALKVGGPNSPKASLYLVNAAEALNALGHHAEAQTAAERALAIHHRIGSTAFLKAYALTMLAQALIGQSRTGEAVPRLEEALTLVRDDPNATAFAPTVRFTLAQALWSSPDSRPRALTLARDARSDYQRFKDHAADVAKVDAWLRDRPSARAR